MVIHLIMAVCDRLQKGLPVLGFVNPRLYQTASAHPAEAFQTMSVGSSCCDAGGDCCKTGYPVLDKLWNPVRHTLSLSVLVYVYSNLCCNLVEIQATIGEIRLRVLLRR